MKLYFKIFNKNLATPNDYTSAKSYPIDENIIITENKNDTLDSASFHLSHIQEIDIEPYDYCMIYDVDGLLATRYFQVDTYVLTQNALGMDNDTFNYEISVFSETKGLEGKILPNLSTTIDVNGYQHSLYYYIKRYMNLYCEKVRENNAFVNRIKLPTETTTLTTGTFDYSASQLDEGGYGLFEIDISGMVDLTTRTIMSINVVPISTLFATKRATYIGYNPNTKKILVRVFSYSILTIQATSGTLNINVTTIAKGTSSFERFMLAPMPEKQWSTPTLRELINDIMMIIDCIPIVRNQTLSYIDLTTTNKAITSYNYLQRSQSSEDYASELKMNLQNSMQNESDIDTSTYATKNEVFTCDSSYLTSQNFYLKTDSKILKINHLYMYFYIRESNGDVKLKQIDLCNFEGENFVKESKEYQVLEVDWQYSTIGFDKKKSYYANKQNYCLNYSRGSNIINGFNDTTASIFGSLWSKTTFEILYRLASGTDDYYNVFNTTSNKYNVVSFQIVYETLEDCVFSVSKSKKVNPKETMDNQTSAWVNAYSQGQLEQQKVNRIGNQITMFNQRVSNPTNAIEIGDYKDDVIIYQTQYQIHSDHIEINAFGVKNFILKDYYTGINSKVRTWVNAQEEAQIRHDLKKFYCEFSKQRKSEYIENGDADNLSKYLLTPIFDGDISSIKYVAIKTTEESNTEHGWYSIDLTKRLVGNSIIFTCGFVDNYLVGKSYNLNRDSYSLASGKLPTFLSNIGGMALENEKYVDYIGQFKTIDMYFAEDMTGLADTYGTNPPLDTTLTNQQIEDSMTKSHNHPKVDLEQLSNIRLRTKLNLYKDNREITKATTQYEFLSDDEDIVFTQNFIRNQKCIKNISQSSQKIIWDSFTISGTTTAHSGGVYYYEEQIQIVIPINNLVTTITATLGSGTKVFYDDNGYETTFDANGYITSQVHKYTIRIHSASVGESVSANIVSYYEQVYKIYYGNPSDFNSRNPSIANATFYSKLKLVETDYNTLSSKLYITGTSSDTSTLFASEHTYYICDNNDNIMLVMNKTRTCYLNILKIRDDKVYNSDRTIVDSIVED